MRNLDTNVLVRYLTADEPRQLALADRLLQTSREDREPLFISVPVLCELVWVLSRSYRQPKAAVLEALQRILELDQFKIDQEALVWRALRSFRDGQGSFSDYLIGEIGRQVGCRDTVTFDRALKDAAGFTLLA